MLNFLILFETLINQFQQITLFCLLRIQFKVFQWSCVDRELQLQQITIIFASTNKSQIIL
jgi:hypothetical protein